MRAALLAALDAPGRVRVDQGDVDAVFARADRIVEATYSTPYLPRARMEPGNATVLVTDERVDIWIGDQSPQETRFSAAQITGIAEENVYLHMCHLGGGFGRNGNGPQAEQALMIANANRGTPIHLLWTREEDFIGTTYRAMGMARLKAALDADGWPLALEVRTSMQQDGFGPDASFDVASRYYVPNYRFSNHTTNFHVPVGTRRGVGQAAHEFYRESFIDELARAAGKDPYRYRRELIARTELPFKADMLKALDMAAEMAGWGEPLPLGVARAIALEERGAETGNSATISAMVHTISVSRDGRVKLERVDVAHESGFGLVNPLSVKKQIEGQITWFYNDAMHQACNIEDGRIVENNFNTFSLSRIDEDPLTINIRFFETGHWLVGMGHDRGTSVQAAHRRRDLPDHGQALSRLAVSPARLDLGLRDNQRAARCSVRHRTDRLVSAAQPSSRATVGPNRAQSMSIVTWLLAGGLVGWAACVYMGTPTSQAFVFNAVVAAVGAAVGLWTLATTFDIAPGLNVFCRDRRGGMRRGRVDHGSLRAAHHHELIQD